MSQYGKFKFIAQNTRMRRNAPSKSGEWLH